MIIDPPKQILNAKDSLVSRPEDILFLPGSDSFAITNSDKDTITFYDYDNASNSITSIYPFYVLQKPEANFSFPHGLSFSPDRKYLAVTQFGESPTDLNLKTKIKKERKDAVLIFKLN